MPVAASTFLKDGHRTCVRTDLQLVREQNSDPLDSLLKHYVSLVSVVFPSLRL